MTWQVLLRSAATERHLVPLLKEGHVAHRILRVSDADLAVAAAGLLDDGFRRLAVEGNDPEVASVIGAVVDRGLGRQTDLAMISGESDLLRTFAADQTIAGAAERMIDHSPYLIDAAEAEGSFGSVTVLNSVAAGVAAGGPSWFPWWPRPLLSTRPISAEFDGRGFESVTAGVLVLNGQFWGDWVAAPRSTLVDGVLDVQLFNGHRVALSRLRFSLRTGNHVRSHHVRRRSVAVAVVEAPRSWRVTVDGIRLGRGPFRVASLPEAVRLAI